MNQRASGKTALFRAIFKVVVEVLETVCRRLLEALLDVGVDGARETFYLWYYRKRDGKIITKDDAGEEGALKVWWKPQMPMKQAFHWPVKTPEEAGALLELLAQYDDFQLENQIKPEFANDGGLSQYREGQWLDWKSDKGEDIDQYMARVKKPASLDPAL